MNNPAVEINALMDRKINKLKIKAPAVITAVNNDSVDVEILTRYIDKTTGKFKTLRLLDVPVMFPASYEDCYLRLPIKKGTTGSVEYYDLDISTLIDGANETPVNSIRQSKHNEADVVFKPNFQTAKKRISFDDTAELRNGNMSVILHNDGKIEISGASEDMTKLIIELSDIVKDIITKLSTTTVATALGASPLSTQADFIAMIVTATTLNTKLKLFEVT